MYTKYLEGYAVHTILDSRLPSLYQCEGVGVAFYEANPAFWERTDSWMLVPECPFKPDHWDFTERNSWLVEYSPEMTQVSKTGVFYWGKGDWQNHTLHNDHQPSSSSRIVM